MSGKKTTEEIVAEAKEEARLELLAEQEAEAAALAAAEPQKRLYQLRSAFWNGTVLQKKGAKAYFIEGKQPRGSKLCDEPELSEEDGTASTDVKAEK